MAIRLSYSNQVGSNNKQWIPVATSEAFMEYWMPICEELGLEWLLLMNNAGIPLLDHLPDLATIINEFEQFLVATMNDNRLIPEQIRKELQCRVQRILPTIKEIAQSPSSFTHAYLG